MIQPQLYIMKFEIIQSAKNQKYYFRLKARNGQIVLGSQGYKGKAAAKKGISSVIANGTKDEQYNRKVAANGSHHFNLMSRNNQVIGTSQMYSSKASMENGIKAVKKASQGAEIVILE